MTAQDSGNMEWATRLMASLRRDVAEPEPLPEIPLAAEADAPDDVTPAAVAEPLRELPPATPAAPPTAQQEPPPGLLSALSPTATAPARPAMFESPLLGALGGAQLASVPAPPLDDSAAPAAFAETSPLLAAVQAPQVDEAATPPAEPAGSEAAAPATAKPAPEAVKPSTDAVPAESAPEAAKPAAAATPAKPVPEPVKPVAAATPARLAPEPAKPAAAATPARLAPEPAKPAAAATPAKPAPEPAKPAADAAPAKPAPAPPGNQPGTAAPDPFGQPSILAAHAALAGTLPPIAAEGPDWVALRHSLDTARAGWTALFLGAAATTALPLKGALAARTRGLKPVLHVTESNAERLAALRATLAAERLEGGETRLLQTVIDADPARLPPRAALVQDLLDAAEAWDLVRIGLPGTACALLSLDMPLVTRKVRWLMLLPGSRAEEAEALSHLLRARWRLVAERPALLNPARPAVATRLGAQLWRGPLA